MRAVNLLIILLLAFFQTGCFLEDDAGDADNNSSPSSIGTLEITLTYNGGTPAFGSSTEGADEGGKINYVYLYEALGVKSDSTEIKYSASSDVNGAKITISGIFSGNYYVVVFYDNRTQSETDNVLSKNDLYTIYDGTAPEGTPYVANAQTISISTGETTSLTMNFSDTDKLGTGDGGRCFKTP